MTPPPKYPSTKVVPPQATTQTSIEVHTEDEGTNEDGSESIAQETKASSEQESGSKSTSNAESSSGETEGDDDDDGDDGTQQVKSRSVKTVVEVHDEDNVVETVEVDDEVDKVVDTVTDSAHESPSLGLDAAADRGLSGKDDEEIQVLVQKLDDQDGSDRADEGDRADADREKVGGDESNLARDDHVSVGHTSPNSFYPKAHSSPSP